MHPWIRNSGKELLQRLVFRERFLWRLPAACKRVALTFDDGPHPRFTAEVLDLLARQRVKASFFVIGTNVERYPDIAARIVNEGHSLGAHGYDHRDITSLSKAELEKDLKRCRDAIRTATGIDSLLFRPPRGRVDLRSISRVCALGYRLVHWTKTYNDYRKEGTEQLIDRMLADPLRARDIVLLHDHNPHTVEALGRMFPDWRKQGLEFHALQVEPPSQSVRVRPTQPR